MSNVVKVYNYDSEGKITATGTMDLDVFKKVPINATIKQPPKEPENLNSDESLWFDEANEQWMLEVDPNYIPPTEGPINNEPTPEERIADLEMALADLIGGGTNA